MPGFDMAEMDTLTLADKGVPMPLLHIRSGLPLTEDDGTPITITLLGKQSDGFRAMLKGINERRAEARLRNPGKPPDADAGEQEDVDLLIACTRDWTITTLDAQPFPCTPQNIQRWWNDPRFRPFRTQGISFMMQDANFLAPPSTKSAAMRAISSPSIAPFPMAAAPSPILSNASA